MWRTHHWRWHQEIQILFKSVFFEARPAGLFSCFSTWAWIRKNIDMRHNCVWFDHQALNYFSVCQSQLQYKVFPHHYVWGINSVYLWSCWDMIGSVVCWCFRHFLPGLCSDFSLLWTQKQTHKIKHVWKHFDQSGAVRRPKYPPGFKIRTEIDGCDQALIPTEQWPHSSDWFSFKWILIVPI